MKTKFFRAKQAVVLSTALALALVCMPLAPAFAATADTEQTEASVVLTAGDLTLESAPDLDFSSHPIEDADMAFTATANGTIAVADLRGSGEGWNLTVALSPFASGGTPNSLPASSIVITGAAVTGTDPAALATAPASITLPCDSTPVPVLGAAADHGMGNTIETWTAANVTLNIPLVSAVVGSHTADLDWVLTDAPA